MKIRTVIVDDEKPARDRIRKFLAEHADFELVGEAGDGNSAAALIDTVKPDLVILDVQMPEADGFEVLRRLRHMPQVVFATAFDRYAVQAFEVHSLDYLLKPFDRKRFAAALARVREEMAKGSPQADKLDVLLREIQQSAEALRALSSTAIPGSVPSGPQQAAGDAAAPKPPGATHSGARISGKRGPRIYLLAPSEILWFEAEGELVFARAGAHRYLISRTLQELEASLDPRQFFRSHRSFIVNLAAIAEIVPEESGNYRIILRDADRSAVPLSRRQARKLRDVFPW